MTENPNGDDHKAKAISSGVSGEPETHTGLTSRAAQLTFMAAISLFAIAVVSVVQAILGGSNPRTFWCIQAGVVAMTLLAAFYERVEGAVQTAVEELPAPEPTWLATWWLDHRKRLSKWVVKLGVVANMVALWQLVDHTGGALASPYAPFLAGPAIFGSFVAQTRRNMRYLLAFASVTIFLLYWDASRVGVNDTEGIPDPIWVAEGIAAVSVLLGAGLISALKIKRAQRLGQAIADAPSPLAALDADELRQIIKEVALDALSALNLRIAQLRTNKHEPD